MKKTVIISSFLASLPCALAIAYLIRQQHPLLPALFASATLFLLLIPYFGLGLTPIQNAVKTAAQKQGPFAVLLFALYYVVLYLMFCLGTNSPFLTGVWKLFFFLSAPAFILFCAKKRSATVNIFDFLTIFLIWVPFDFGLLKDLWPWPKGEATYVLNSILAVGFCTGVFTLWRPHQDIGYKFHLPRAHIKPILINTAAFCLLALGFGLWTKFIAFRGLVDWYLFLPACLGIFVCIAIPEELLFRGLLQNFLLARGLSDWQSLIIAATIFGATHLNNGPAPDWRYFFLATIAGIFYGRTYQKTKSITAAAIVHTIVDGVWIIFFRS